MELFHVGFYRELEVVGRLTATGLPPIIGG
jgi:hypothetical protein